MRWHNHRLLVCLDVGPAMPLLCQVSSGTLCSPLLQSHPVPTLGTRRHDLHFADEKMENQTSQPL